MNSQTYTELPEVGDDRVRHSRPSVAMDGHPVPDYGEGRRCELCPTKLSRYNGADICYRCMTLVKAMAAAHPGMSLGSAAMMVLESVSPPRKWGKQNGKHKK